MWLKINFASYILMFVDLIFLLVCYLLRTKLYYGWSIVFALAITETISYGVLFYAVVLPILV